jgi:hypothetical protein
MRGLFLLTRLSKLKICLGYIYTMDARRNYQPGRRERGHRIRSPANAELLANIVPR